MARDPPARKFCYLWGRFLLLWNILLNWVSPDRGFWKMLGSKGYSWELLQIGLFGFLRTMVFTWVGEFDVPISMSFSKSLPRPVQPFRQKMKANSIFPWVFENPYPGQCNPSVKIKALRMEFSIVEKLRWLCGSIFCLFRKNVGLLFNYTHYPYWPSLSPWLFGALGCCYRLQQVVAASSHRTAAAPPKSPTGLMQF